MTDPTWWHWHEQIIKLQDVHCFDYVFKWDLLYKAKPYYMTHEGYGTGSTCWYVALEIGYRMPCCADTPEEAVAIGLNTAVSCLSKKLEKADFKNQTLPHESERYRKLLEELQAIDTAWTDKPTQDTYRDRAQQKRDEFYGAFFESKVN